MRVVAIAGIVGIVALFATGCFDPHPPDGALHCSPKSECPPGYLCVDTLCRTKDALDLTADDQ